MRGILAGQTCKAKRQEVDSLPDGPDRYGPGHGFLAIFASAMKKLILIVFLLAGCGDDRKPISTTGTVVFIGDSITSEWPLEKYVHDAVNAGVSGNETTEMLSRFDRDVLARQPALVVIHGGINDIRNRRSSDIASILAMVQMAQAANVRVVVGNIMAAENLGAEPELKDELIVMMNADLQTAASSFGFELVDYHAATVTGSGKADRRKLSDGLHPNKRGYDAMWGELLPALRRQGVVSNPSG
jgi:acyl-CoA thioesterase I